ncbi:MAG TPA: hypothetical protein VLK33_00740, partial [Terriglobales bacterium]|nr:hypothetical protein [Terriglobales bacterium]
MCLASCAQAVSQRSTATDPIVVAVLASSTPLPKAIPTAKPTKPTLSESDRQTIEGAFSFIAPTGYTTALKPISAEIDHSQDNVFLTIAIIGLGDDERTARGLLNDIFEKFQGID